MDFILLYAGIFIIGLFLGSYLNSWMWRVHECKWVFGGRSMCVHCSAKLAWYDNIPLVSFIMLGGKCRTCKKNIPKDYFIVELLTAVALTALVWFHGTTYSQSYWPFLRDCFFVVLLIVTFFYDAKHGIILSGIVWAGTLLGLWFNIFKLGMDYKSLALGAVVGSGFFLLQYVVSKGRWIGGGDIRLGVMMGAWLGFPQVVVALFFSYIIGAICAVPLLITRRKGLMSEVPFGTFLSVGTVIALFWGQRILDAYLKAVMW